MKIREFSFWVVFDDLMLLSFSVLCLLNKVHPEMMDRIRNLTDFFHITTENPSKFKIVS